MIQSMVEDETEIFKSIKEDLEGASGMTFMKERIEVS